ncbi:hypothetical protein AUJ46_04550 [Candidatus Peregrinibacteria bacterium CG1_02_54_53]|nr:MAG: hypothetical protein AUJ46_04550 [Candidatus Peregrinibacteria bacterium CG1_02_54_53]
MRTSQAEQGSMEEDCEEEEEEPSLHCPLSSHKHGTPADEKSTHVPIYPDPSIHVPSHTLPTLQEEE